MEDGALPFGRRAAVAAHAGRDEGVAAGLADGVSAARRTAGRSAIPLLPAVMTTRAPARRVAQTGALGPSATASGTSMGTLSG